MISPQDEFLLQNTSGVAVHCCNTTAYYRCNPLFYSGSSDIDSLEPQHSSWLNKKELINYFHGTGKFEDPLLLFSSKAYKQRTSRVAYLKLGCVEWLTWSAINGRGHKTTNADMLLKTWRFRGTCLFNLPSLTWCSALHWHSLCLKDKLAWVGLCAQVAGCALL